MAIFVQDGGPGVRRVDADRVFLPFQRVHGSLTEGVSGTGLGLGIARDLAQRMGGSLDLVAAESGARFELRLKGATREVNS